MDALAMEDRWVGKIHPLVRLFVTLLYIVTVVSFPKYDLAGVLSMAVLPVIWFITADISVTDALRRLRIVLPLVMIIGIFNPFFDRAPAAAVFGTRISGGVLSMLTLMGKAVLTVLTSYLLIATTPVRQICSALRKIRVPKIIVTEILLIYRYITVLLAETQRIRDAYMLRAPGQKGIARKAWGPLVGQLLLRSMDRAGVLYESMQLRGFRGEFYDLSDKKYSLPAGIACLAGFAALIICLRFFRLPELFGRWITG